MCVDSLGGDQLTAARTRSSKRIRSNSMRGRDKLEGLEPICEDWHAKMCILGVCAILFLSAHRCTLFIDVCTYLCYL